MQQYLHLSNPYNTPEAVLRTSSAIFHIFYVMADFINVSCLVRLLRFLLHNESSLHTCQMKICKYSYKYERIDQHFSDCKPRNKLSKTASRIIHDHSINQILTQCTKCKAMFATLPGIFPWYTTLLLLLFSIFYSFLHLYSELFSMNKV